MANSSVYVHKKYSEKKNASNVTVIKFRGGGMVSKRLKASVIAASGKNDPKVFCY